ncbi:hypothetical protein A5760_22960 [Mycobacterium colombiense]|uniref:HTH luxR-type domain-containing protein n=1 Tax=Mycobacterium colombiense TaxID=339268 RepID=A0A1A0W0Y4_9MYCO|nr:helix-turn-helix transcriptional regulator [Mycobacterium colombiense]OBB89109.1 hypothetical protein A5760_22960 [Mycobacterium colombiense]
MRADLARAQLLYGEWLRRERRRTDARIQLRIAHDMLDAMGMEAFAEWLTVSCKPLGRSPANVRSGRRKATDPAGTHLARMACDGLSNPEIGARLFISTRTVRYHLHNVFAKLDISSRSQLDRVFPSPV